MWDVHNLHALHFSSFLNIKNTVSSSSSVSFVCDISAGMSSVSLPSAVKINIFRCSSTVEDLNFNKWCKQVDHIDYLSMWICVIYWKIVVIIVVQYDMWSFHGTKDIHCDCTIHSFKGNINIDSVVERLLVWVWRLHPCSLIEVTNILDESYASIIFHAILNRESQSLTWIQAMKVRGQ